MQLSDQRSNIPNDFLVRFAITYLLLGVLSLIVESVRARVHMLLDEKQKNLEELNKILYENSIRDSLTGFYNRSFLSEPLEKLIALSLRRQNPLSVILLDLDNFKAINDQCGHVVGDGVLSQLGVSIRDQLKRKTDIVIRYGGDEFLIVLPDTKLEDAKLFAEQIKKRIKEIKIPKFANELHASLGLSELLSIANQHSGSINQLIDTLISVADGNLYQAKYSGGNKVI
jgi:diguanylate cyclase (GGDEF)-like protein